MRQWLVRAGLMVVVHVAVRTALGYAALSWPTSSQLQRNAGLVVVLAVALLWSGVDALRENPDDEDRDDLTLRWLKVAVLAGPVAGLVGWSVEGLFIDSVGTSQLAGDVIGGGAFTALLIFVPAILGLLFGRLARTDRKANRREPSV
ncbi:MAG: B-4DMT family transporter [Mycobacteriaceae bacterium]